MTPDIALTLALLTGIAVLLATEWLPLDLTALLGLVALVVTGLLSAEQALLGFANEIIVTLACVFVIAGTLARSGLTQHLANAILKAANGGTLVRPLLMGIAAALSAFFSNTSATGMLMPAALRVARRTGQAPGQLLMPLAFAAILGGTCTLIGTSTNLASASLMIRLGLEPFSLFEFTGAGLLVAAVGITYLSLLGHRLIPKRLSEDVIEDYKVSDYLSELLIADDSSAIGETLGSLNLDAADIAPLALVRKGRRLSAHGNRRLRAGDTLIVQASRDALLRARDSAKFSIEAESKLTKDDLASDDLGFSEVVLVPQSPLVGRTLRSTRFRSRFRVAVLAINSRGRAYAAQIDRARLRVGDVLLLQGARSRLRELEADEDLWILKDVQDAPISTRKGLYALAALLGAVVLTGTSVLPVAVAFLLAGVALVLARCTTMEEAYASIEWRLLVLIACMSAFGVAMHETGTAAYLARWMTDAAAYWGVHAVLAAFAVLAVVLTQPMSNAAAALVLIPIAVSTAHTMGADPRPFAAIVTLSSSLSFITPLEPASLLVLGVGRYRFTDFLKVGLPLTALVLATLIAVVPIVWPPYPPS